MCNCRSDIEARLVEKVSQQMPEGSRNLSVSLGGGYAFLLGGSGIAMRNVMPIDIEYEEPLKKRPGEFKRKRPKLSMHGNYCMFCGVKYEKDADETEPAAPADQPVN